MSGSEQSWREVLGRGRVRINRLSAWLISDSTTLLLWNGSTKQSSPSSAAKNNTLCASLSSAAANGLPPEEMVGLASAVALWFWQEARPRVSSLWMGLCVVEELKWFMTQPHDVLLARETKSVDCSFLFRSRSFSCHTDFFFVLRRYSWKRISMPKRRASQVVCDRKWFTLVMSGA